MKRQPLEVRKFFGFGSERHVAYLRAALPLFRGDRCKLLHRPRAAEVIRGYRGRSFLAVKFYCGTNTTSGGAFLERPEAGEIVCARCEFQAVKFGKRPPLRELVEEPLDFGGLELCKK